MRHRVEGLTDRQRAAREAFRFEVAAARARAAWGIEDPDLEVEILRLEEQGRSWRERERGAA